MISSYTVVGYVYKADIYCPQHAVERLCKDVGAEPPTGSTYEEELDVIAENLGIDRYDEHTYDSDNFPKVIFADQAEEDACCICHERLVE